MYELEAIAAVVIGGTSLMGGSGSVIGTLIGALIMARHLTEIGHYLDQFNAVQRKELLEAVVQTVTVEGPARAESGLILPIRPLGKFYRQGSKWCPVWRPESCQLGTS